MQSARWLSEHLSRLTRRLAMSPPALAPSALLQLCRSRPNPFLRSPLTVRRWMHFVAN